MYDQPRIGAEGVYSLVYWALCLVFVVPPREVASAGVTIQNLFAPLLGDERIDFVKYHIRRGSVTLMVHSLLPFGYLVLLVNLSPMKYFWGAFDLPLLVTVGYAAAFALPISAAICVFIWSRSNWKYHPISTRLKNLIPGESGISSPEVVTNSINMELRRPDLFNTGPYSQKVYVTDSWIIKAGTYSIDIVHQSNCVVSLHGSEEYTLSEESPHGVQMLQIDVRPVDKTQRPFVIRLNAVDYGELKAKLSAPLVNVRNIVVRQTVTERFVEAFKAATNANEKYRFSPTESGFELDSCIGCMQETANVKLKKMCSAPEEGDCQPCFCRPLWCIECLAKWFCNRQDQNDTSNWLAQKAGCPMCRAKFCMLDVCAIELF